MGTENQEKRETGRAGDRSNKSLSVRLLPWALGAFAIYTFATNSIVHGWMGLPAAQIIHITIGLAVAEAVFLSGRCSCRCAVFSFPFRYNGAR